MVRPVAASGRVERGEAECGQCGEGGHHERAGRLSGEVRAGPAPALQDGLAAGQAVRRLHSGRSVVSL